MRALVTLSLAGSSLLALIASAPALAGDIEAHSAIDAVTVYPDAAIVTRVATLDLPAGDSTLAFKDLPLALDPASLRVAGMGDAKITIGAVDANVEPAAAKPADDALEAKLASLKDEREALRFKIEALKAKRDMILNYAKAPPGKPSADSKPIDVSQWGAAWDAVGDGLAKLGDDLRPAESKARDLDEEIKALEAERQRPSQSATPRRAASVALSAAAPTHATITLSYRIAGAGWIPAYDASLDTSGAKSVSLARRALLSQRTGEDWSNVALTVSTARAARSADAPEVRPVKIDFWQPPVAFAAPSGVAAKTEAARSAPAPADASRVDQNWGSAQISGGVTHQVQVVRADESPSQGEASAYSAEFKIPGRISLPADGAQKSFLLARVDTPATILIKASPGLDQAAYLETHLTNGGDAPLLPGEAALHRDDMFVGRAGVSFVAPGDSFDLGFGADDKVKILRAAVNRKENEPTWYNQTKVETREFKTTIKNLHDFPVKVQVIDQLPYSENTAITTELLPLTTQPTEKQVGDKRGVMSWTLDLAPGESKDIRLAYRMKWPADRDVVIGSALPFPPLAARGEQDDSRISVGAR